VASQEVYAQGRTTEIMESDANRRLRGELIESAPGEFSLFGEANFGFDSTRHFMMKLDSALLPGAQQGAFRLSNRGQFNDVELAGDDFLICGTNSSSFAAQPYIIKVDENLQPLWALYFQNLDLSQRQIIRTFSEDSLITAYSYSSPADDIVYRFQMRQDKSGLITRSAVSMEKDFRFYAGAKTDTIGTQVLVGQCEDNVSGDNDGLLVNWGNSGIKWAKYYDFGVVNQEEFSRIIPSQDGQFLATATHFLVDSNRFETFVLKLNQNGNAIWVKKIFLYGGTALLGQIAQTASGDILLGGITNNFEASLVKLDSTGNLIWTRKWTAAGPASNSIVSLFQTSTGEIMSMISANQLYPTLLDSSGNGCMFEAGPNVQSETFTEYQVTDLNLVTASFVEMSDSTFILPRQLDFSSSVYCSALTSVTDELTAIDLQLYPQPADEQLFIQVDRPLGDAYIQIFNLAGQLEMELPFQEKIVLGALTPGLKVMVIKSKDGVVVRRFLKG